MATPQDMDKAKKIIDVTRRVYIFSRLAYAEGGNVSLLEQDGRERALSLATDLVQAFFSKGETNVTDAMFRYSVDIELWKAHGKLAHQNPTHALGPNQLLY